jgi:hypothetical protein
MTIKNIQIGQSGVVGPLPQWVYINTNDTYATVTTAGYLSTAAHQYVDALSPNMMALVSTQSSQSVSVPPVLYLLQIQNSNGVWSLVAPAVDVPVPFIVPGNIQAGQSGIAGYFISFPSAASKGSFIFKAVANTGNTNTTLSNDAMGQDSIINIPDPANAIGQLLIGATATPFVNGNFPVNSGTAGLMVDSGVSADNLMKLNAVNTLSGTGQIVLVKANGTEAANAVTASGNSGVITTSSLSTAGGSSYAITWTNTLITSTSVINLTIMGGTNTTENITLKATAGSGTSTLTIYNNTAATALNGTILIGYTVF